MQGNPSRWSIRRRRNGVSRKGEEEEKEEEEDEEEEEGDGGSGKGGRGRGRVTEEAACRGLVAPRKLSTAW